MSSSTPRGTQAQENADAILQEGMSDNKVHELKKIMDDLRLRLSDINHEVGELRIENNSLTTKVMDLQRKLSVAAVALPFIFKSTFTRVKILPCAGFHRHPWPWLCTFPSSLPREFTGRGTWVIILHYSPFGPPPPDLTLSWWSTSGGYFSRRYDQIVILYAVIVILASTLRKSSQFHKLMSGHVETRDNDIAPAISETVN
ncbi:hypothetical protein Btru_077983 [Bulinus truncatus]|nr:hypothetical protein Btru_077983 [Bulinus truncatus]